MTVVSRRTAAATKANNKLFRRVLIWRTAKSNPALTYAEIGRICNVPEYTVGRIMKLRDASPKELLEAIEVDAVRAWRDAIPIAGRKGDHRPAKDLLLHTKAITPVADQSHQGLTVTIGQLVIPGLSRVARDYIDVIPKELSDSTESVTTVSSADAGADGREGDPPGGSG